MVTQPLHAKQSAIVAWTTLLLVVVFALVDVEFVGTTNDGATGGDVTVLLSNVKVDASVVALSGGGAGRRRRGRFGTTDPAIGFVSAKAVASWFVFVTLSLLLVVSLVYNGLIQACDGAK